MMGGVNIAMETRCLRWKAYFFLYAQIFKNRPSYMINIAFSIPHHLFLIFRNSKRHNHFKAHISAHIINSRAAIGR